MLAAPIPENEPERIASLRKMLLLSSPDEEAFERVTRTAQRLFKVPIALVSLIDTHRQWFKSCIGLPIRETGRDVSFCAHAILVDELMVVEDANQDIRFADNPLVTGEPHVIFYAGRPLKNAEGFNVGTLCIIDHQPRAFDNDDRRALNDLGHWIEHIFLGRELSVEQKTLLTELDETRRASMLDPMLNIWNRAAVTQILERENIRAFRNKTPLSVMMIDVDRFKQINDEFGHSTGDAVLIEIAKRMLDATRTYDVLGRYGGDEFAAVLPHANVEMATEIARRLLLTMKNPFIYNGSIFNLSISVGIASTDFVADFLEANDLLANADQALLSAKRHGKNCFEIFLKSLT